MWLGSLSSLEEDPERQVSYEGRRGNDRSNLIRYDKNVSGSRDTLAESSASSTTGSYRQFNNLYMFFDTSYNHMYSKIIFALYGTVTPSNKDGIPPFDIPTYCLTLYPSLANRTNNTDDNPACSVRSHKCFVL